MQVLSMMGYTETPIGQLHNELFRAGGPHKFPYRYMDAKTVTDLLHSCGGVVVLAHPGQYKADNVMEMMIEEHMLDGIELNHPRNDEKTREHITSLCKEHDLFMTGGTDFHGLYTKTPYPLGSFLCPKEGLHRLILAGEQANKAFYEKHPKFKKYFYLIFYLFKILFATLNPFADACCNPLVTDAPSPIARSPLILVSKSLFVKILFE